MADYTYYGPGERIYPDILTDAGSLIVEPGDVHDFDVPPSDGLWLPSVPLKPAKKDEA